MPQITEKLALHLLNLFVEPKLMPECAIQNKECPLALTPPAHLRTLDNMMKRMELAFKKLHIEYVACAGTALGAARHGGFIPWDDDGDFFVTRDGLKTLLKKEVREILLKKYKLKVITEFRLLGTLKLVLPGKTMQNSPFIDIFSTRERVDKKGHKYLMNELLVALALYILNPGGSNVASDRLYENIDYVRDANGTIRFLTTPFPWYDRTMPIPASGMKYVKRVFGKSCITHAVLRIYVPIVNKSHKFRDITGVYRLAGTELHPILGPGGKVIKPGSVGELRSEKVAAKQGRTHNGITYFPYWGNERTFMLKK